MEVKEIYDLFKHRVFKYLNRKINASIYTDITDDVLTVRIYKFGMSWERKYPNILNITLNETDKNKFGREIVSEFQKDIQTTFFY